MSRTYSIACKTCRIQLWIGQAQYIYTGMPKVMKALSDFLYAHQSHELVFEDSERLAFEDYTEIDADELPESDEQRPAETGGYDVEPSAPYQYAQPCIIPRSVADKIQKAQAQWEESHHGLPRVTIQIPMPPVKEPNK